jgi:hypothetical protein
MALVGESRCRAAGPFRDMTDSHMSGMIMHAMTLEETGVDFETDPAHDDLAALREGCGTRRSTVSCSTRPPSASSRLRTARHW